MSEGGNGRAWRATLLFCLTLPLLVYAPAASQPVDDRDAISPRQMINAIDAFDDHEVVVRGHLSFGSQTRQLWQSEQARRDLDFDECITLINTEKFAPLLRQRNGSTLVLLGIARRDASAGYVDYGSCNDVGVEIIRVIR